MTTAFLITGGLWASYVVSSRAFLRDFNAGVHSYLSGRFVEDEQSLLLALQRRPRSNEVKQLLYKVLIERSFAQYHQKDYAAAIETLDRASRTIPAGDAAQSTFSALREQLALPAEKRPVNIEEVLGGLYKHLPVSTQ